MSIFSSIGSGLKSVAKGVYNTVNTIGSTLAGGFSKFGNQIASVYNAVTPSGGNQSTYNSSTYQEPPKSTGISKGGTQYYGGYVPSTGSYIPSNASQGGAGFGSYGPQLPVTITAGKVGIGGAYFGGGGGSNNSQIDIPYGPTQISPTKTITNDSSQMAANRAKLVADSGGKLKEVDGKVVPVGTFGANSVLTSDTFSGGSTPLVLGSTPTSTNPKINTSGLAGTLSGYKKYNATTGQYEDIPDEQVIQERKSLYDRFVGKAESVYDDPEVKAAREERRQIQERLRTPMAELNAIVAKQNQDLLQLRQTGSQEGVTEAVYGGQSNAINYNAAIRALPLQASIAGLQGDLKLAQDYLSELVQVKGEQIKNQYEYNKGLFQSIEGALDKADQRQYEEMKTANDRAYTEQQNLIKTQATLTQTALARKAPATVISRINNSDSILGAIEAAGEYGVAPNTEIRQLDNGNTVVIDKNTNKIISDLGGAKPTTTYNAASLTPKQANDPFIQKMAKTAGGKPLTDTFAQQLNKGLTVLNQVGLLQANINGQTITTPSGVKVEGMKTGPIVGLFRGKNPWDTKAQVIKAQLNAIIPNLARGVYGEVGVLTDNDIAQYAKTLPNLTSTEDIRNAVFGITVDMIAKSIKQNLEVNAANGKDVSGFIDIYTNMQGTRDSIFSQIPGYKGTGGQSAPVSSGSLPSGITFKVVK